MKKGESPYVLLDAGNTIVHLDFEALVQTLVEAGGEPVDPARLERAERATRAAMDTSRWARSSTDSGRWKEYIAGMMAGAGVAAPAQDGWAEILRARDRHRTFWRRVPDETRRGLDRLAAAGVRMAVVSNSDGRVREILRRVGILDRFEFVIDSSEEGVEKPDPEIFRRALARAGVGPDGALYVGDLYHIDVLGARAAGLDAVLVDPDGTRGGLDCPRVRDLDELAERLLAGDLRPPERSVAG
ncbi:MAG: HAD-IA family hydrolase [Planctomycetes bacterium]|nr:HAD-IA family hydrolase [Planctomycetota bacterium]